MEETKDPWRPLKFKSVEELQEKIDGYFKQCDSRTKEIFFKGVIYPVPDPIPYTITGLAYHLETSRKVILDYEKMTHESIDEDLQRDFSNTITRAKLKIHNFAEVSLWTPKISGGVKFNLVNNWGWVDKQVIQDERTGSELTEEEEEAMDATLSGMVGDAESNSNT